MNRGPWLRRTLIVFALISGATTAHGAAWTTTRQWTNADEERFSQFIATLPLNYLNKGDHPYSGIPTDCADAAYTLRTIFAAQNGLPVSFSTFNGTLTNETTAFDGIADPVKRVRKFIAKLNYDTNTQTLAKDSYPIAIRRGVVRPGTMFLHPQGSSEVPLTYRPGHVYYIQTVRDNGIIKYISSTVPAAVRDLNPRNGVIFAPMGKDGGYRAWKWPNTAERPNQSEEQFQIGGWREKSYRDGSVWSSWQDAVVSRLRTRLPTPKEAVDAEWENLENVVNGRIQAVSAGWNFYRKNYAAGQCTNEADYDSYSTSTRDVKVQVELQNFAAAAQKYVYSQPGGFFTNYEKKLQEFYRQFQFTVAPGVTIDINNLRDAFLTTKVLAISEPEHSPEVRWGLKDQGRWVCPHRAKNYHGGEQAGQN